MDINGLIQALRIAQVRVSDLIAISEMDIGKREEMFGSNLTAIWEEIMQIRRDHGGSLHRFFDGISRMIDMLEESKLSSVYGYTDLKIRIPIDFL